VGTLQITFIPGLSKVGASKMLIEAVRAIGPRRGTGIGGEIVGAASRSPAGADARAWS
jgi:hypothetical protein